MGKKDKAAKPVELSKKERKALEAREAELAAELAKREAKAAKKKSKKKSKGYEPSVADQHLAERIAEPSAKKGKKAKVEKPAPKPASEAATAPMPTVADALAERRAKKGSAKGRTAAAAERVIAEGGSEGAIVSAITAKAAVADAADDETDEQIKARVSAKRARREELAALFDSVDRDDEAAVKAYNDELAALGGGNFVSSNKTKAANDEKVKAPKGKKTAAEVGAELLATAKAEASVTSEKMAAQVVEPVETEDGTVFQVGSAEESERALDALDDAVASLDADEADGMGISPETADKVHDFAMPSDVPLVDFETNGNGQYKIKRPSDGKIVGYTRATTYINNLEDQSALTKWKMRMLLEGVAINDTPTERGDYAGDPVVAVMRDLIHRRDMAIAKARKQDRKGKLDHGELATYVNGAWAEFKKAVNELAEELLETGGVHEKANKGTDIHALCEVYDREGIDAVGDMLTEGKITPADLADVEAYADAIKRAGIVIDRDNIEQVIVNHELKVAGRLDRTGLVKFPGAQRAVRCVIDIKTGRIDLGAGKIAQQLELYAGAEGYDLNTHETRDLKLSRTKAVVVHLPAGTGTATVHPVDLSLGRRGNKLSGEVRAWRNEGKKAIDAKTDLAAPTVLTEEG